jgi:lipoprotein-anchoring transpeptidase ErfK/SrfK
VSLVALLVAVGGGALLLAHVVQSGSSVPARHKPVIADVPPPVRPAFVPGRPRLLPAGPEPARWAPVLTRTEARAAPRVQSGAVATLERTTPEATTNIVLVLGTREDGRGRVWAHVRLPVLPNGTTGWVPRSALGGYGLVRERLVVDLEHLRATLLRDGRVVFRAPIGVGRPETPTPRGRFFIRDRLTRYSSPFYGPLAFGTSARSATLTDWPAGGFIGIHGTDQPQLLPGRVSHGCIRLRNPDILRLARLMPVGTPLTIR